MLLRKPNLSSLLLLLNPNIVNCFSLSWLELNWHLVIWTDQNLCHLSFDYASSYIHILVSVFWVSVDYVIVQKPVMLRKSSLRTLWLRIWMKDFTHQQPKDYQEGCFCSLWDSVQSFHILFLLHQCQRWRNLKSFGKILYAVLCLFPFLFPFLTWNLSSNLEPASYSKKKKKVCESHMQCCFEFEASRTLKLPSGVRIQGT